MYGKQNTRRQHFFDNDGQRSARPFFEVGSSGLGKSGFGHRQEKYRTRIRDDGRRQRRRKGDFEIQ